MDSHKHSGTHNGDVSALKSGEADEDDLLAGLDIGGIARKEKGKGSARATPVPFTSAADTSILPIVTSQRDRFRQRNAELEEVRSLFPPCKSQIHCFLIHFRLVHIGAPSPISNNIRATHRGEVITGRQPQAIRKSAVHAELPRGAGRVAARPLTCERRAAAQGRRHGQVQGALRRGDEPIRSVPWAGE